MSSENLRCYCHRRWLFVVFLILLCCCSSVLKAQQSFKWDIAVAAHAPLGEFGETHFPGAGAEVSFSINRFGKLPQVPKKKISYLLKSGAGYFFGRDRIVSGYPFTYGGYSMLHIYGGIIYNQRKRTNIQLAAGPALSLYKHNLRFNIGSSFTAAYYVSERTGIAPSFQMISEWGARPLWYGSIKISRVF